MADRRRTALDRRLAIQWSRKWFLFCVASTLCALGAPAYLYFDDIATGSAKRADRIDFSSLATIVPIDESEWRVQGLRSELKDDQISNDVPRLVLATTGGVKTNLQDTIADAAPKLSALVAKHAAKLRQHLEQGTVSESAAEAKAVSRRIETPSPIARNPATSILAASLGPGESRVAKASSGLNRSVSEDRSSGKRGALSGLVH